MRNTTKQFKAIEAGLGILLIASMFMPWLSSSTLQLSGWDITQQTYFLAVLPLVGVCLIANACKWHFASLPHFCALGTGAAAVTLISEAFNSDSAALSFINKKEIFTWYIDKQPELVLGGTEIISYGFYIVAAVSFTLFLLPLIKHRFESKTDNEPVKKYEPKQQLYKQTLKTVEWFIIGSILIFTFTWCKVTPGKLWDNRKNAIEYIFGKTLSDSDIDYIKRQAEKAPRIEAEGRARAQVSKKYKDLPFDKQPGFMDKEKEVKELSANILTSMSKAEKEALREQVETAETINKRGGYFPPETGKEQIKEYMISLAETIAMALWGTVLAIVTAIPVALLAAENTLQLLISSDSKLSRFARMICIQFIRRFLDSCRGFNEFVMALIFVAVIGLGPFAGILALWIHTFGVLGKVFSEQIETIDHGQIEALQSSGATLSQTIIYSVLPQVMPGFVSYSLLRFESNVRSASVLGFVGAGGIGFLIYDKVKAYYLHEVCTIMIIIIITVGVIDYMCKNIRKRFV